MPSELLTSFLGAIQASISVLLVISFGVIAAQFNILKGDSTKQISTLRVRMFLPALLITNVGSQLHAETGIRYIPILIWGLFYALTSMLLGYITTRVFKLPSWVTPAISFNNTTALPLLLIESLSSTGILDDLLASDTDTTSAAALMRAKSYFLVNAIIGDSLTFAMGRKLLDGEEVPDKKKDENQSKPYDGPASGTLFLRGAENNTEEGNSHTESNRQEDGNGNNEQANEQTSLLPGPVVRARLATERYGYDAGKTNSKNSLHGYNPSFISPTPFYMRP